MFRIRKIIKKIYRIITGRKGIRTKNFGKGNKWKKGVLITENCNIGSYNYFNFNTIVNNSNIGNYCSFAPNVQIGPGKHSKNYITTCQRISSQTISHKLNSSKVNIGNDVWCGANVVIMQGVSVGDGAIIGANAVVTKDIPSYAIAVGLPAEVIKYRFSKEKIDFLKKKKWYKKDLKEAKSYIKTIEKDFFKLK